MSVPASEIYYPLLQIFILLAFAELVRSTTGRAGLPQVVGEVIAGMVLSYYFLGGILNNLLGVPLFTVGNDYVLIFADFSVVLLIFAAGLQGGLAALRRSGLWAVGAAVAGDLIPFFVTFGVFSRLYPTSTALLLAVAAGATSTAVVASLLKTEGLGSLETGQFLLTTSAVDDVVGLFLLSAVLTVLGGQFNVLAISGGVLYSVAAWVLLLVVSILVVPRIFRIPGVRDSIDAPFVVLFALVAVVIGIGFSALVGAFIAGLAIAESVAASRARQHVDLLLTIFGALFFVVIGSEFNIHLLLVPSVLAGAALLFGIAAAGKFVGVYVFARGRFHSDAIARAIAVGAIPRGEIGLVVGAVGLSLGLFDQALLGAIVLMSLLTTVFGSLLLRAMRQTLGGPPSSTGSVGAADGMLSPP
jgi:Kef-type K+ transport system membrane component KefB